MAALWARFKRRIEPPERLLGLNFGDERERFRALLERTGRDARILDVGAGGMRMLPGIVTMELRPTAATDVAGDALDLPFRTGSLDGVMILNVLEHVRDPARVAAEIGRVLRPGGAVYAVAPFVFPYHEAPEDHWRYSVSGIALLFERLGFQKAFNGFQKGPYSTYLRLSVHFWALFFSCNRVLLYKIFRVLFSYLFSPFRFFDHIVYRYTLAHVVCSSVYFIGVKAPGTACGPSARA